MPIALVHEEQCILHAALVPVDCSTGDEAVSIACGIVVGAVPFTSSTDAGEVPFT